MFHTSLEQAHYFKRENSRGKIVLNIRYRFLCNETWKAWKLSRNYMLFGVSLRYGGVAQMEERSLCM